MEPTRLLRWAVRLGLPAFFALSQDQPVFSPQPGFPAPWQSGASVYGGVVNLVNGNLALSVPIVSWANGPSFQLIFNSQADGSSSTPFGRKGSHNYHAAILTDGNHRILREGDGSTWHYTWSGSAFVPPSGIFDELVQNQNGTYKLTRHGSEDVWHFNSSGVLTRIADKYGVSLYFTYTNGVLTRIQDWYEREINLSYTNGRLTTITDPEEREWTLAYDGSGRLTELEYPALSSQTYTSTWTYNNDHNVMSWTDRLNQVWLYRYGTSDPNVLVEFEDPDEQVWVATYGSSQEESFSEPEEELEGGWTRWTDPTGVWTEYGFGADHPIRITQGPSGGNSPTYTTTLAYTPSHLVTKRTDPTGLVWEYAYNAHGHRTWMKEPNGAETTYTYHSGTDNLHTVTNELNQVWTYTYTNKNDLKTVEDPEEAVTTYEYEYEQHSGGRPLLMKITDPLERETEFEYSGAYDLLSQITLPGGARRQFLYDDLGRLTSRAVEVSANTFETTSYGYDAWGRLTLVDYPTSHDLSYTYDAENRRLTITDALGTRAYAYDAWGRVTEKENCCEGTLEATYDPAGRRLSQTETAHERTIEYAYDAFGRLETIGDYRGSATYEYDGSGRLWKEHYPNGTYVQYTYYGVSGTQAGQLQKQEHRLTTGNSLIVGYEYTYDLLGRVVSSLELPSEDETEYEYWSSGRLKREERTGTVSYVRDYAYHPDGSRATVTRNDALNGEHEEEYAYDEDTGHLLSVTDTVPTPPQVHTFTWNMNGTLSRWTDPSENYDRVFSYDEEGRLTKIAHDEGPSELTRYEYQYTGDGIRYLKKDHVASKEYRYGCSIDCGGTPMRVYERTLSSQGGWTSMEDYVSAPTFVWYNESSDYGWLPGHWLSALDPPGEGEMFHQDRFGVQVAGDINPQAPAQPLPEYIGSCLPTETLFLAAFDIIDWIKGLCKPRKKHPPKKDPVHAGCMAICQAYTNYCRALPPPGSSLCNQIAKRGCKAMCDDIQNTKWFADCITPCKAVPITECSSCCDTVCQGAIKSKCFKMCASRD